MYFHPPSINFFLLFNAMLFFLKLLLVLQLLFYDNWVHELQSFLLYYTNFFIVQIKWFMYLIENCEKNRCTQIKYFIDFFLNWVRKYLIEIYTRIKGGWKYLIGDFEKKSALQKKIDVLNWENMYSWCTNNVIIPY